MRTITKRLFYKEFSSPIKYGYKPEHKVDGYIEIYMYFDFKHWLRFGVSVTNSHFCHRNPFKALMRAMEHESVGMLKYERIKSDIKRCGLYNRLDVK